MARGLGPLVGFLLSSAFEVNSESDRQQIRYLAGPRNHPKTLVVNPASLVQPRVYSQQIPRAVDLVIPAIAILGWKHANSFK